MATVLDRVKKVTAEVLKVDPARVEASSRFVQDLGAQSMQAVELMAALEVEFELEMDQDAALAAKTVGDAAAFVEKLL